MTRRSDPAVCLLLALRNAGCDIFIDDGEFYCSPPLRRVDWDGGDVEAAIEEWYDDLKSLLQREHSWTVH